MGEWSRMLDTLADSPPKGEAWHAALDEYVASRLTWVFDSLDGAVQGFRERVDMPGRELTVFLVWLEDEIDRLRDDVRG
jgi:hypothetical protein